MRPARPFKELDRAIRCRSEELGIAFIGIGLEDTTGTAKVSKHVFLLPVGGELVDDTRWCLPSPRALIENIGPDAILADALTQLASNPWGAPTAIHHPNRLIIGMQQIMRHDVRFDPFGHRQ